MRRAASSPILFVRWLSVLFVPACFNLPKADVSTRVVDDFTYDGGLDAATSLTWGVFAPWSCEAINIAEADGGAVDDASPPLGPDGGPPVTCTIAPGEYVGVDAHALAAAFDLAASTRTLGVAISTHTVSGSVDLGGFQTLQFYAWLRSSNHDIPEGTKLKVELGCPAGETLRFVASQVADSLSAEAVNWGNQVRLKLAAFQVTLVDGPLDASPPPSEPISACLRSVDSIRFIVPLQGGTNPIAGTLLLDGIEVTTTPI